MVRLSPDMLAPETMPRGDDEQEGSDRKRTTLLKVPIVKYQFCPKYYGTHQAPLS